MTLTSTCCIGFLLSSEWNGLPSRQDFVEPAATLLDDLGVVRWWPIAPAAIVEEPRDVRAGLRERGAAAQCVGEIVGTVTGMVDRVLAAAMHRTLEQAQLAKQRRKAGNAHGAAREQWQ